MKVLEAIRKHPLYVEYYEKLRGAEKDRVFCCHQMEHLLDVARIAYIINLEQQMNLRKEVIYGAALLHDIGKYRQYAEGIPHEIASEEIAGKILADLPEDSFTDEERREILRAIRGHRKLREDMAELERLICVSDKKSRKCFACQVEKDCNWSREKKDMNMEIEI